MKKRQRRLEKNRKLEEKEQRKLDRKMKELEIAQEKARIKKAAKAEKIEKMNKNSPESLEVSHLKEELENMKLQMAHDREARDIHIKDKEKQEKIAELDKLLLLKQLENFSFAQDFLKKQITDVQKENETELENLNNTKKELEGKLKEMGKKRRVRGREGKQRGRGRR